MKEEETFCYLKAVFHGHAGVPALHCRLDALCESLGLCALVGNEVWADLQPGWLSLASILAAFGVLALARLRG